jgi:uncharacterized membrane protein
MATAGWAIGLALITQLIGSFGPIYLKKASGTSGIFLLAKNKHFWLGVFFYVTGISLFTIALSGGDLSVLYPLVATSYVWVSLLSIYMLGETMNKHKWTGILLIILGVLIIATGL